MNKTLLNCINYNNDFDDDDDVVINDDDINGEFVSIHEFYYYVYEN